MDRPPGPIEAAGEAYNGAGSLCKRLPLAVESLLPILNGLFDVALACSDDAERDSGFG
jgi:hypothetical protein